MSTYLTVDSGSTNTRISLICDNVIVDTLKFKLSISDSSNRKEKLSQMLKDGIDEILVRNKKNPKDISCIIACGMITSEFGIINLAHVNSPCGIYELSQNLYKEIIPEISQIPFVFIRGVKYLSDNSIDMMRGEETEIYGISEQPHENSLYVLPGSHSKLIYIDEENRISNFSTELTGELISAVANHTILSDIIDLNQNEINPEYLQKGYLFAKEHGINAALFKVRSLKLFLNCNSCELYNYFIGAVLAPEINNIIKSSVDKIIVGGKRQLKIPITILVQLNSNKTVETVPDEIADNATAYGCVRVYEKSLEL